MDPPPCVQNAMMTKDKKPFTYTPGGIDLSEVRSPRMQRRIERNANLGGVSEVPKPPPPQNVGPLPPSALAAMRPQTQVQVFPGPPPPPPMQKNIPPPPPPPTGPLPTQKVTTSDNQVLERPDMTKIIPDNPMALLRRTGGPAPRKSFVEQMYEEGNQAPPSPPQRTYEAQSPRYQPQAPASPPVQQQRQAQPYQSAPQQYQPPVQPVNQSQPPQRQYQPPSPPQSQYQQPQYQQPQYQQPQPQYQPSQVPQRSTDSPNSPSYHPPIIERQPTIPRQEQPPKTINSSVGSLYIPPLNQQQQQSNQQRVVSPPSPPERNPQMQSPGTPTLKEAPRPWQQKTVQQQQELPPWARKDNEERAQPSQSPPSAPNQQQRWQQPVQTQPQAARQQPAQQFSVRTPPSQNQPLPSHSFPVHIEIRSQPSQPSNEPEERKPNAVYITQPVVLQHPGSQAAPTQQGQPRQQQYQQPPQSNQNSYQQQQGGQNYYQQPRQVKQQPQPKQDSDGVRIIPIQIEGRTPPSTPGNERGLSRQLSWGTQPPQSNSFKVIQKFTRTDDEEDDDTPVTQHSARYPQEMTEQVRRMKINDNGHFKQVPQHSAGGRSVPTQVEVGNGQPQPYVHPSEQVVPEPKKYMGSNIPSRSFKILQAMTAPSDSCANANYNEEIPYNPAYNPYNYPYYPPAYWPEYYPNFYPQEQSESSKSCDKSSTKSGRSTPLPTPTPFAPPYWHEYYPNFYPQEQSDSSSRLSERSSSRSGRSTPLPTATPMPPPVMPPYWGFMPPRAPSSGSIRSQSTPPRAEKCRRPQTPKPYEQQSNIEESLQYSHYPMYPPYYDPYYYSYYYGYPPIMPPYPYYPSVETEELSGYSSMDEMSNYASRKSSLKRRNSLENSTNSVQSLRQHFEVRSKSAAPRITITPTFSQERLSIPPDKKQESEESDTEVEEEKPQAEEELCTLKSIKSVPNINVYAEEQYLETESDSEETSEEETEDEDEDEIAVVQDGEEIIPHQLSIIYEESERGDSRWSYRPSSVASESTTIAEHKSEDEDEMEDFLSSQNVKYKINLFQETSEKRTVASTNEKSFKSFDKESESCESVTIKSSNLTSRSISPMIQSNNISIENYVKDENGASKYESQKSSILIAQYNDYYEKKDTARKENVKDENQKGQNEEVIKEKGKERDDDWWGVIENKAPTAVKRSSIIEEKERDVILKTVSVMGEEETEVVSVKLRNKSTTKKNLSENTDNSQITNSSKTIFDNSFFDVQSYNRNSVYDILKEDEDAEEIVSGGTLMRVDSFASKLEEIKRNSGLWNLEDIESNNIIQPIKEEINENESPELSEESNNSEEEYNENDNNNENLNQDEKPNLIKESSNDDDNESDEVDFWSQIKSDDDDFKPRPKNYFENQHDPNESTASDIKNVQANDSASSRRSSYSKSHTAKENPNKQQLHQESYYNTNQNYIQCQDSNEDSEASSDSESSEDEESNHVEQQNTCNRRSRSKSLEPQTIKDRIEALRKSIAQKQKSLQEKDDVVYPIKNKIEVPTESRSKTASTKSSVKSFEEYSEEEEVDSGVISDISRHISDNEEFPELKKLTRYERAATHSRLFKLLQDECDIEEEEEEDDEVFEKKEDKFSKLSVKQNRGGNSVSPSRSKLSLPLNKCNESSDDKELPVNQKLVDELVQSLLRSKKAQMFRNMPKEKLHAAAIKILQEGIDSSGETPSEEYSSLLSPLRGGTESSTPAQTPQEFYGDYSEYKQYYDSWGDATNEIVPSKAFKLLQEHLGANKLGTIEGILAKCPRILSSKNVPKEIMKLLDENCSESSTFSSQNPPQSNDVTNT